MLLSIAFFAIAAATTPSASADVLSDSGRLKDVAEGSHIVAKHPYVFAFLDGVGIHASWFADCIGSVEKNNPLYKQGGVRLELDDYLAIDHVAASTDGEIRLDVSVHLGAQHAAKEPRQGPMPHFALTCAHNNFGLVRTTNPNATSVADLRRALGWDVWVEDGSTPAGPTVADNSDVKSVSRPTDGTLGGRASERLTPAR